MGFYLNSDAAHDMIQSEMRKTYYVDKSLIIKDIIENDKKMICITRPRRFGKSMVANLIASFFGKSACSDYFSEMKIAKTKYFKTDLNKHNVIFMDMSKMPESEGDTQPTYNAYIKRVKSLLKEDLLEAYQNCKIHDKMPVWDMLEKIRQAYNGEKFIFVIDEWDYIFHQDFVTEANKKSYIKFLSDLLKGQTYVEYAYMTGILPIAKYASGSELNCFLEYTMATRKKFSEYFGFSDEEVDDLYSRYLNIVEKPEFTREDLQIWYDGYFTAKGERLYNPRSVVSALGDNELGDYWSSSGPYEEIYYYVKNNIADVRDDIAMMLAGEPVKAQIQEYSAVAQELRTKDQIFSAMVVYGFLTVKGGFLYIPNRELMDKFSEMVKTENSLGYIYSLAKESEKMLAATKSGNIEVMMEIIEKAHNTETSMLGYNSEAELSAMINLMYLYAREYYRVQREEKSGTGYVDYVLYPKINLSDDCIIIELKIDSTAGDAIQQIKSRHYTQEILGKIGEKPLYTGRILAVGISYQKKDKSKKHDVKVEVLRDKL